MSKVIGLDLVFEEGDEVRFWSKNPQLKYIEPYSVLYNNDESKDKTFSSKQMWIIVFMNNPDEEENVFFRSDVREMKRNLEKHFAPEGFSWDDLDFEECLLQFPEMCMTSIERELQSELKAIKERKRLMDQPWTLDYSKVELDKSGTPRSLTIIGTAKQLNALQKDSQKVIDGIQDVIAKYYEQKEQMKGRGDSSIPVSEKKGMW